LLSNGIGEVLSYCFDSFPYFFISLLFLSFLAFLLSFYKELSLFYERYSNFLEGKKKLQEADKILLLGINRSAQPLDRLQQSHRAFQIRFMANLANGDTFLFSLIA